jgi:hypothetical protein
MSALARRLFSMIVNHFYQPDSGYLQLLSAVGGGLVDVPDFALLSDSPRTAEACKMAFAAAPGLDP